MTRPLPRLAALLLAPLALGLEGCTRTAAAEGGGWGQGPPVQAQVVTLAERPLEDTSDYVATLASRQSVTLFPQVSGYVRVVDVKPGATVAQGQRLLELDTTAEQAALDNLAASRAAQATGLQLALERQARATALRADGVVSQQAADEARAQAEQAQAALQASDALLASQRARLGYFRISAPLPGVVGNVLVKLGDFVTPATALTTVSKEAALEADVWVPAERAGELSPESRIRLLGPDGALVAEQPVSFVAPRVDPATQLVLVKAVFEQLPGLRPEQAVKARVLWRRKPGLAVPPTALVRQAGQAFAYVVERPDGGAPVARRVPLTLGRLTEGEVAVLAGLDAGAEVVVSGTQQLSEGAPVDPRPAAPR